MKFYGKTYNTSFDGSPVNKLFTFLNVLVAETPDIDCISTEPIMGGYVNCHVCCYGMAEHLKLDEVVVGTGIYGGTSHHSWLEYRERPAPGEDFMRLAVLDIFPVNSPAPLLLFAASVRPVMPVPSFAQAVDDIYYQKEKKGTDPTFNSLHFEEDVGRMAEAFRETQRRLKLEWVF